MVPAAVCKDTKASLLVHLRDETLDFSGGTETPHRIIDINSFSFSRGLRSCADVFVAAVVVAFVVEAPEFKTAVIE